MPADNRMEAAPPADVIVHNGRIATQDDRRSFAQAAAVRDGKFVAVGSDPDVLKFRGEHTQVVDVGGRTVIPGLNDSHLHIIRGGLNYNLELRWDGVPSLADALRMLREQARRTPPPQWVRVGGGWTEFQFAERRMPTLEEINAVSPDTPVFVLHLYDRALLNGAALRACGYTKDTPDPPPSGLSAEERLAYEQLVFTLKQVDYARFRGRARKPCTALRIHPLAWPPGSSTTVMVTANRPQQSPQL